MLRGASTSNRTYRSPPTCYLLLPSTTESRLKPHPSSNFQPNPKKERGKMAEIAVRNHPTTNQFLGAKTLTGGKFPVPFHLPTQRRWNSQTLTLYGHGVNRIRSELGKSSTYSSRISTDIPLYETAGASFDQYLEDKPRVFEAIFPDRRRSQRLNEEEWRIQMLPIQFLFLTVWPVVDMRIKCRAKGQDYPPGIPRDISKVLELDIIRWELQGLDDAVKPNQFSLSVKGALYPDRRGPRIRLKGQLEMKITVVLPQMLALLPEDVLRNMSESVLTRLVENMKEKVNSSLLLDYSKFRRERQKNLGTTLIGRIPSPSQPNSPA